MDTSLFMEDEESKYDTLTKNTCIADLGPSTYMYISDEGMFQCCPTPNQYIKVGNENRLPILKKGMKRCIIVRTEKWKENCSNIA